MAVSLDQILNGSMKGKVPTLANKSPYTTSINGVNKLEYLPNGREETPHYMVMYINAIEQGKFAPKKEHLVDGDSPVMDSGSSTMNKFNNLNRDTLNKAKQEIESGRGLGQETAREIGRFLGIENVTESSIKAVENFVKSVLESAPRMARTKYSIVLPIPEMLQADYNAQWNQSEAGAIGDLLSIADQKSGSIGATFSNIAAQKTIRGVANFIADVAGASGIATGIEMITKKVSNPRPEMLFKGVGFRTFFWSWKLYAKNAQEARAIWQIVQTLKFNMLPELDEKTAGAFYLYPGTFDIELHSHNKPNSFLFKTSTCALTNMSVNFADNGRVIFFDMMQNGDIQGAPTVGVQLNLTFQELEVLTKDRLIGSRGWNDAEGNDWLQQDFGQTDKGVF